MFLNRSNHIFQFLIRKFAKHGKRQDLSGGTFGLGEIPPVQSQKREGLLQMKRNGIIYPQTYSVAAQLLRQCVAPGEGCRSTKILL